MLVEARGSLVASEFVGIGDTQASVILGLVKSISVTSWVFLGSGPTRAVLGYTLIHTT
jgi:hypothetical protein